MARPATASAFAELTASPRRALLGAGLLVLGLIGLAVWAGWTALSLRSHLEKAGTEAKVLQTALVQRDRATAEQSFAALADDLAAARSSADSPVWRAATLLPVFGDDAGAIRTVAQTGSDLVHGGLRRLVATGDWRLAERLTPRHGRIDLRALRQLAPTVHSVAHDFALAERRLAAVRESALTGAVRPRFEALRSQVRQAAGGLGAAERAVQVLPRILGAHRPQTWLLAFNNNAEVRATGGVASALALVRTDHGRITMVRQVSSSQFGAFPRPVLPQSKAEHAIYDTQPTEFVQDTNLTPAYSRTATLLRAMWQRRFHQRIDGVASIDAVSMSYLLRATGPIKVDGTTLASSNATDMLLHQVYELRPTNAQQDAFFRDVAKTMFQTVTDGTGSPSALIGAITQAVGEGRVYAHAFDPATQRSLEGTPIAGDLDFRPGSRPQLGLYLNDSTGAKMSYYLRTHTRVRAERCTGGRQTLQATMIFHSIAPKNAAKLPGYLTGGGVYGTARGHQLVLTSVYGPAAGSLANFRFDGHAVRVPSVDDRGRPVATTVVELSPGQTIRMTWQVTTGPHQPGNVDLSQGPGMESRPARTIIASACTGG